MAEASIGRWNRLEDALATLAIPALVRRLAYNNRLAVPVLIVLICGSFAAAALLQMQLDRSHALEAASRYAQLRVTNLAAVSAMALDRLEAVGESYARAPETAPAQIPGLRNIAVFGADGQRRAIWHVNAAMAPPPPNLDKGHARAVFAHGPDAALAFTRHGERIVVLFDGKSLAPPSLRAHGTLIPKGQTPLLAASNTDDVTWTHAPVPGWPLTAGFSTSKASTLSDWAGTLPLYLFVALGPALAGAWMAALLVGSFERQRKAALAIRNLKSTRPIEAKLMVRLANAERGAAEALRAKSEFMAHMSHELRTPLNAVIGFSEIIAEGYFGPAGHPKYAEYARDIGNAGKNLHTKIGDILEFANIEAGRFPLCSEPVDLAALASACIDDQMGRAFSRRISLNIGLSAPGMVRADPLALRRILTNLLVNALTYTAEGGQVWADIRFEEGAGVLTLSDSGVGFSASEHGKAGKAFARFDRSGTVTGAGLGLAIAMELARRMGGAMTMAGSAGQGAVMQVRLPRL